MFTSTRYANVTATLALVVALGGTGYAASQLPRNSVGSKQLKQSSVKTVDVKDGDLTGADVKDGDLTSADVRDGTLTAQDLAAGVLPAVPSAVYAHVAGDGVVYPATSQGVVQANVSHPVPGVYCFSGLAVAPRIIVSNIDVVGGGGSPGPHSQVGVGRASDCPVGTQATVVTANNNFASNYAFYVPLQLTFAVLIWGGVTVFRP